MKRLTLFLITLLITGALVAQPAKKRVTTPASAIPKVEFEKYTLPNGLQVILHVDRKLPVVHVNQWYHVGSKNERPGRTGFAHLFEHVMFQGSKNAVGEYFTFAERAGANLREGGVNGTTSNDRTNYFVTVPSGNLEQVLWLESDRLATLGDALTLEKLDEQRAVVRNERRQSLENVPYGRWYKLLVENMNPMGHPYSWSVIGSHEDLIAASLDDVKEFFKRYYTPNNLTLVVAGDFEPAEAKRLVAKYFGGIAAGPALDRPARNVSRLEGEKVVEVRDRVPQERTYFAWNTVPYFDKDEAALEIATLVLTDGLSSRLKKSLVYDKQIATNVTAFPVVSEISGNLVISATARPDASLPEVERIVTEEISRLAKGGPSVDELERAKTKWEYNFISGLERIGGFGGKADLLAQYNTFLRDPAKFGDDIGRFRAVTTESVRTAVGKYLDTRNRLLIRFHPEVSARAAADTLDRSTPPVLGTDRRFVTPEVKAAKLSNGMDLFVVERSDLPKVAITFATLAGSVADRPGKEGLSIMMVNTIDTGTKSRGAIEIEDALGNLGTALNGFSDREYSVLGLEVLKRNLKAALSITADVVRNPLFPASEISREKKRILDGLAQQLNNPNQVANLIRPMLAFGKDHPYGRPLNGLPSTVSTIERSELAQFHSIYWKPKSSAIIFAGDLSLSEAKQLAEEVFGGWVGDAAPSITIPAAQPMGRGKIFLVDKQDAAQTVVAQILPAPKRNTDDYVAYRLVDSVWGGGGFGTRLNLNLRENKGYSYGVFSNMSTLNEAGHWWAGGGVQTDKTKESIVEFVSELKNLGGVKPISDSELVTARESRVRGYAQQFESLSRIAGQIATLWAAKLPMSELQREVDATSALDMAIVAAASKKYVDPSTATLLLVGDLSKIEPGIRSLNLGEVVVLTNEGKPVNR
ncbi:MAG TPA: pitrilysin family protein [Thermoanaerobaculia bacterium]|nr:pitrilysin family protein [Thermoanaerobaculia bacterium]